MLLLLPASVVAVATFIRGILLLRGSQWDGGRDTITAKLRSSLTDRTTAGEKLTQEDARDAADDEALALYSALLPLQIVFVLAPLVGLVGTVWAMISAYLTVARTGATELLASAMEQALIPTMWGLGIAIFSYAAFAVLRARLYYCEQHYLRPAARGSVDELRLKRPRPQARLQQPETPRGGEEQNRDV